MTAPSRRVAIAAAVCGAAAGAVGLISLSGRAVLVTRSPNLAAPFTATALLLLGLALVLLAAPVRRARWVALGLAGLVALTAVLSLLERLAGRSLSPEWWLLDLYAAAGPAGAALRHSRPLSDLLLGVLGTSILLTGGRRRRGVSGLAAVAVLACAVVLALGYAYGVPLVRGGADVAASLSASLGFLALGAGVIALAGADAPPLVWFAGPASRRVLLRWFLPVTLGAVLLSNLLIRLLLSGLNPALASTLTAVLVAGCAGAAVFAVSRAVGRSLDRVTGALSAKEARARGTLDGMLEGCQIVGTDWRYLYVNDAAATHGRRPKADLLGRTMMEAYPGIDRTPMFAQLRSCMEQRAPRSFENEFRYPDGSVAWFALSFEPVPEGVFILSLDITERKKAEDALRETGAKLQAALASMTDAVFISDAEGRFVDFNDAFATFHRFRNRQECARTLAEYPAFLEVYLPDGTLATLDQWAVPRALRGESASRAEYTLRRKDTGETWVGSYSFAPIRDGTGAIVGSVVAGRDITERIRAEEEIRRLNAGLERRVAERTAELSALNAELEAFTYSVSHDLRAPLRQADGFAKILLEDYGARLDETGRHYLARVREGTRFMGQLVDELLNLSRLGRRELVVRPVSLEAILRESLEDLRPATEGRRIEWKLTPLPTVACDPALVRQVFANLLANAVKFTRPRDPAVIEVAAEQVEGATAVMVRDNGVGFDPKYGSKLFGVFQRLHRQEEFEGTGIGLATVQRIVHKHGGRVWAEGEPDHGAAFHFTLGPNGGAG